MHILKRLVRAFFLVILYFYLFIAVKKFFREQKYIKKKSVKINNIFVLKKMKKSSVKSINFLKKKSTNITVCNVFLVAILDF
jgi:hypothetical protein